MVCVYALKHSLLKISARYPYTQKSSSLWQWVKNNATLSSNPEIITVDPQRKCHGLKTLCRSIALPGTTIHRNVWEKVIGR
jgi:hypothetical protein